MKPKVFVPHLFTRWEPANGIYVPTMSTLPASRIGELIIINDKPLDCESENFARACNRIFTTLEIFEEGDYLALMGDSLLFSYAVGKTMQKEIREINLLRWNRDKRSYDLLTITNGD